MSFCGETDLLPDGAPTALPLSNCGSSAVLIFRYTAILNLGQSIEIQILDVGNPPTLDFTASDTAIDRSTVTASGMYYEVIDNTTISILTYDDSLSLKLEFTNNFTHVSVSMERDPCTFIIPVSESRTFPATCSGSSLTVSLSSLSPGTILVTASDEASATVTISGSPLVITNVQPGSNTAAIISSTDNMTMALTAAYRYVIIVTFSSDFSSARVRIESMLPNECGLVYVATGGNSAIPNVCYKGSEVQFNSFRDSGGYAINVLDNRIRFNYTVDDITNITRSLGTVLFQTNGTDEITLTNISGASGLTVVFRLVLGPSVYFVIASQSLTVKGGISSHESTVPSPPGCNHLVVCSDVKLTKSLDVEYVNFIVGTDRYYCGGLGCYVGKVSKVKEASIDNCTVPPDRLITKFQILNLKINKAIRGVGTVATKVTEFGIESEPLTNYILLKIILGRLVFCNLDLEWALTENYSKLLCAVSRSFCPGVADYLIQNMSLEQYLR